MFHFQNFQAYINKEQRARVNDKIWKIFKEISMKRSYDLQIWYVVFIYIDTVTAQLYSCTLKHKWFTTTNKLILSPYPRYAEEFTGNLYICDSMEFPVMCNLCFIMYLYGSALMDKSNRCIIQGCF